VLVLFFVVLPGAAYVAGRTSCLRKDEYHHLVIENRMPTDVTIVNQDLNDYDEQFYEETLGTVPAGQTENVTMVIPFPTGRTLDSYKRTHAATIQVKAKDPAGSVVWQKSWARSEFGWLHREGWRIVISPETDEE